jgi:hypothetical protein
MEAALEERFGPGFGDAVGEQPAALPHADVAP